MAPKKNFYAVRIGRKPGIYKTWAECQKQVIKFQGAAYKGFVTEDEAKAYMSGIAYTGNGGAEAKTAALAQEPGVCYAYVDGSYFNGRYSWGMAIYKDGQLIHKDNGVGESKDAAKLRNVSGELEGAKQAVLWAEKNHLEKIVICHDYTGIAEWAEGRWKTNNAITTGYKEFMKDYLGWVRFQKVAGHTGIEGNELADKLAKAALEDLMR